MPSKSPKEKKCEKELERCRRECDELRNQVEGLEIRAQIATEAANIVSQENSRLTDLLSRASFLRAPSMGGAKSKHRKKKYLKRTRKKKGRRGGSCGCNK